MNRCPPLSYNSFLKSQNTSNIIKLEEAVDRSCSVKKCSEKFIEIHRKTPVPVFYFIEHKQMTP